MGIRRGSALRLGIRGVAREGPHAGREVFVDSLGMTPVDPLAVLVSPDVGVDHADQILFWVDPEDVGELLRSWKIVWGEADAAVADRLQSMTE